MKEYTEAEAAKAARLDRLRIVVQGEGRKKSIAVNNALHRGFLEKDLWLITCDDGTYVATEVIDAAEECRRVNGNGEVRKRIASKQWSVRPAEPVPVKSRKGWEGVSACALIRYLASEGEELSRCVELLGKLGIEDINPATYKIQHRKGRRGEEIPEIGIVACRALCAVRKAQ